LGTDTLGRFGRFAGTVGIVDVFANCSGSGCTAGRGAGGATMLPLGTMFGVLWAMCPRDGRCDEMLDERPVVVLDGDGPTMADDREGVGTAAGVNTIALGFILDRMGRAI